VKNTDLLTKTDPYVVIYCEGKHQKTKVINNNLNPVWNQDFEFELTDPGSSSLTFLLYDSDTITHDDLIASANMHTNQLRQGEKVNIEIKWFPPENGGALFLEALATNFHGISGEVEKLHQENDKYQKMNEQLNQSLLDLKKENETYHQLNDQLKATSAELKKENEIYHQLNDQLISTSAELKKENETYHQLNAELKTTSTELKDQVTKFENKLKIMTDELHNLQKTREALDASLNRSEQQNAKLSEEVTKLHTIEEGLQQFAQKQGADYAVFVGNLTNSINKHQQLLKEFAAENEKLRNNRRKIEIDSMVSLSNNFQMLDGKVGLSVEEFQSYLNMLGPDFVQRITDKAPGQSLQSLFLSLDKDKNGTLNIPELRVFLESTVAQ